MSQEILAIYENGLFRPLDPVSLAERDIVSLVVGAPIVQDRRAEDEELTRQREALAEMFAEAESLPLENPKDHFSGADHDLALYGWKK